ncbi:MAG: hypothetical protein RL347_2094 [Actinomycetota bacterium]|jgi:hypothetical protein
MRRLLAAACVAAIASLALSVPAQAADLEYVALNEKGMKQVLIKKSWGPRWFGTVDAYDAEVKMTGARPEECYSKGKTIKGEKSAAASGMAMDFKQNKEGHHLDVAQFVYQYKDVQTAEFAWQQLLNAGGSCAGTHTHEIKAEDGTKLGEVTVKISVFTEPGMYGQQQLIINEDVQYVEPTPGAVPSRQSYDHISIWMYDGMAIVEVEASKFVPKQKSWVFSEPQIATVETLALLAIQRYHLTALKAL